MPGCEVELTNGAAHYLCRVLRVSPGQAVTLFNGDGYDYPSEVRRTGRRDIALQVSGRAPGLPEPGLRIIGDTPAMRRLRLTIGQIADTVVTTYEGRDVRVKDLGGVEWSHKEREILTRTDGGESVQIEIFKEADANIVALAQRVKAALGQGDRGLAADLREAEGVNLQIVADRSLFIESSINEVRNTALLGGLLATPGAVAFACLVKALRIHRMPPRGSRPGTRTPRPARRDWPSPDPDPRPRWLPQPALRSG